MDRKRLIMQAAALLILLMTGTTGAKDTSYTFGVLNQRNPVLTAQYWNPILEYVSRKSGVRLQLQMGKTVQATDSMTQQGEFDFVFSNHIFMTRMSAAGYTVIARSAEDSIRGQIVVLEGSTIRALSELNRKEVAFPSETAFVAYTVTMNAIQKKGIQVLPVFAGNQEGVMGQLKAGKVPAASVNSQVMLEFARREQIAYRALWSSEPFAAMPIAVHPRVNKKHMQAVRKAFVNMAADPEGLKVLQESANVIKQKPPLGFTQAGDGEYENQREFYRSTLLKGD